MRHLQGRWLLLGLLVPLAVWAQTEDVDSDYDGHGRFAFTRVRYGSGRGRFGGTWAHDYPRDEHLPRITADPTTIRPRVDGPTMVLDLSRAGQLQQRPFGVLGVVVHRHVLSEFHK